MALNLRRAASVCTVVKGAMPIVIVCGLVLACTAPASSRTTLRSSTPSPPLATPAVTAVAPTPSATTTPCATPVGSDYVGPYSPMRDGPPTLWQADSVWQDGSVLELGCLASPHYVWTARRGDTPIIGEYVENAQTAAVASRYNDQVYTCPRAIGRLTITALSGQLVQFRSATGVTGTFDLATHAWNFG
jgi:hypothetical protein